MRRNSHAAREASRQRHQRILQYKSKLTTAKLAGVGTAGVGGHAEAGASMVMITRTPRIRRVQPRKVGRRRPPNRAVPKASEFCRLVLNRYGVNNFFEGQYWAMGQALHVGFFA